MFVPAYISTLAIIAVLGCEEKVFLTPDRITSDDYSSGYPSSHLIDFNPNTFWWGYYYSENVIYYFDTPIYVTEIFVHNLGYELHYLRAYGSSYWYAQEEYVGAYSTRTWKANNVYSTYVNFYFRTTSSSYKPRISAAYVFGCYHTSAPTVFPTTAAPTNFPTMNFTNPPSETPSYLPTTLPTTTPTTAAPTDYPSTYPTLPPTTFPSSSPSSTITPTTSPSTGPTPASARPSLSPTFSPTSQTPTLSPSAEPTISPTFSPTVFEVVDDFSLVLGKTSLIVSGGAVFISCVGFISLWCLIQRRNRRHQQAANLMSEESAMDKNRITPNKDESYFMEDRVSNETPGNIQLGSVRGVAQEDAMIHHEARPTIGDELYFITESQASISRNASISRKIRF